MPTIQMPDAFGAGVNAADSWAAGQNDAKAKALALAREKQKDDRAQANSDRTFNLTKSVDEQTQARATRQQNHDFSRDTQADAIAKQNQDHANILFPLLKKKAQLDLQAGSDEHAAAGAKLAGQKLSNAYSAIQVRFGPQAAADAHRTAMAQLAHEQASTAHENAETGLTQQYTANLKAGLSKTGKAAKTGGKETFEGDYQKLTPQGQASWNAISSSNNKATPGQLLATIDKSPMNESDKHLMRSMLQTTAGRGTGTRTDASVTSEQRYDTAQAWKQEAQAAKNGGEYMAALDHNPKWSTIPMQTQMVVRQILNHPGMTPQKFEQGLQNVAGDKTGQPDGATGLTADQAQTLLDAMQ